MQVSTKLLNQQQVRQFSKINDKIAEATRKAQKTKTGAGGLRTLSGDDASSVIKRRNERRAARKKQQQDLSDS